MNRLCLLLLLPLALFAQDNNSSDETKPKQTSQPYVSPEEVQAQLTEAEAQYNHALELFNPWYTGPLITPSASMVAPGHVIWQPYIFFTDTYGAFDEDRKRVDTPNSFQIQVQPVIVQTGITPSVDATVVMSTVANWKQGEFGGGFNDINLQLGFLIQKQGLWIPGAKFSITQSFPTGKFKNLDPDDLGLDATGAGAWKTQFSLVFSKLIFWNTLHPFNTRVAFQYTLPTVVEVSNFNAYGGGFGTHGTVRPGNSFAVDLGLEVSINQPWVIALDVVYSCQNSTNFHGKLGTTTKGGSTPASVGGGFNDSLSLAPAVEYNYSGSMGLLGGVWFTVYGRNTGNFVSGIFSWYIYY